jgi:hypothetical protein
MLSTAKQAKTAAFESVGAKPFTRVHGRPTRRDYEILKEEACAPASKVEEITYGWSKNLMDNYRLLADIMGIDEYDDLTGIATYVIARYPQVSILGIWNSHVEPVSLTQAKLACAFWHTLGMHHK